MTTTNKAFIQAFNTTGRRGPVGPLRGPVEAEAFFGTSQVVTAGAYSPPAELSTDVATSTDEPEQAAAIAANSRPLKPRRPLSEVQAEELFRLPTTTPQACQPIWPLTCQHLLAQAADRYDSVLRKLPTSSSSMLLGVVGATPECGATTTAICLAVRSAALGHTTALVDGHLTRGGLAQALSIEQFHSWGELLSTDTSVVSAIQSADDVGVDLLLTKPLASGELESTARFRASLAAGALRRKYQRVIVDLGCPSEQAAHRVSDLAAAMGIDFLIASAAPTTTEDDLATASGALGEYGLKIAGVIEAA